MNFDSLINLSKSIFTFNGDNKSLEEQESFDFQNKRFDLDYKRHFLKARKIIGYSTAIFVWIWLSCMIIIVINVGYKNICLSDSVVITLISTTTLSVVALLAYVIKNLYPN